MIFRVWIWWKSGDWLIINYWYSNNRKKIFIIIALTYIINLSFLDIKSHLLFFFLNTHSRLSSSLQALLSSFAFLFLRVVILHILFIVLNDHCILIKLGFRIHWYIVGYRFHLLLIKQQVYYFSFEVLLLFLRIPFRKFFYLVRFRD